MLKRGQSEILITVILILVVIAAIVTVGVFIKNSITKGAQESETRLQIQTMNLKFDVKSAYINRSDNRTLFVSVFRESGSQENIDSLKFTAFDKSGESYDYIDKIIAPGHKALETKVYTITAVNLGISSLENITRVWIYYGLNSSSGSFVFSNLLDEYGYNNITNEGDIDENFGDLTFAVAPCTPLIQNGSWSNWTNLSCLTSNLMNQSRTLIQYDVNGCGVNNISFYDYRQTESCIYEIFNVQNSLYVREGATGSNNGSDWNNAYTNLPATLIRGFTYYFADGNYPGYTFDDAEEGEKYITIKKATSNDHGTNIGWQENYGEGQAIFGTWNFLKGYYIIDGRVGDGAIWWNKYENYGFFINISGDQIKAVTNGNAVGKTSFINFSRIEISTNSRDYDSADTTKQYRGSGFYLSKGGDSINFDRIYMHDIGGVPFHVYFLNNSILENLYISENGLFTKYWDGSNWLSYHTEIMAARNMGKIIIRNSIFRNFRSTGGIIVGNGDGWEIYGNIFYWSEDGKALSAPNGPIGSWSSDSQYNVTNFKIYNNLFYNLNKTGAATFFPIVYSSGGHIAYNNLWVNCKGGLSFKASVTHDYNAFFNSGTITEPNIQNFVSNPLVNPGNNGDFHLMTETSPGKILDSPFNLDKDGNIRGEDGIWDRGAYEY
jgi:hypothetical protein